MSSVIRQNYREDCEASINNQINMKLYVSYVYMSMSYYYDRADVALPGMAKFFKKNSDEERDHAEKLMKYQNSRGGRIALKAIAEPKRKEWGSALDGLQTALDLEKQVNKDLLDLHALGGTANDPHLTEFMEDEYLSEQVEAIKKLGDMITKLKRAGPTGVGEYLFDTELQS